MAKLTTILLLLLATFSLAAVSTTDQPPLRANPFPTRLHNLLDFAERAGDDHIISWCSEGQAFKIHDEEALVPLLAMYFRTSTFKFFLRLLQSYGFHRTTHGVDKGVVSHPYFVRGSPSLSSHLTTKFATAEVMWPQNPELVVSQYAIEDSRNATSGVQTYWVTIPDGIYRGMFFYVNAGGQQYKVTCPPTNRPRDLVRIVINRSENAEPLEAANMQYYETESAGDDPFPPKNESDDSQLKDFLPDAEPPVAPKMRRIEVVVPQGSRPNQMFTIQFVNGRIFSTMYPPNVVPGQKILVEVPPDEQLMKNPYYKPIPSEDSPEVSKVSNGNVIHFPYVDDNHPELPYETMAPEGRRWTDKLQHAVTMESSPPPTTAPIHWRPHPWDLQNESKLGTLSEIADVLFSRDFLIFILMSGSCIYLLLMIVSAYNREDIESEETAYDYQKMADDEEDEPVEKELSLLEKMCRYLDKLQESFENEDTGDDEDDEKADDDDLSVPGGCEEVIEQSGKPKEITREEVLFLILIALGMPFIAGSGLSVITQ